jgi:hypothetical protein
LYRDVLAHYVDGELRSKGSGEGESFSRHGMLVTAK